MSRRRGAPVEEYYCEVCDSHMSGPQTFQSHMSGKKHLKNMKKDPSELFSKNIVIHERSLLEGMVQDIDEPVVGLDSIEELRRPGAPMFMCYLCHGNYMDDAIISHLLSTKHRLNFLKRVEYETYEQISQFSSRTNTCDVLIEGKCQTWEDEHGRGKVKVTAERPKAPSLPPWRRPYDRMDEDDYLITGEESDEYHPKGITGIDLFKDIKMMSNSAVIQIMSHIVNKRSFSIRNEEQAEDAKIVFFNLKQGLMQYEIRQMPTQQQVAILREVLKPDVKKGELVKLVGSEAAQK